MNSHDQMMTDVYKKIYGDFYSFREDALDYSRKIIKKNLAESEISLKELRNFNVLNVGPAREAKTFVDLGASNVYHFDISEVAVNTLEELKKNGGYNNLHTKKINICIPGSIKTD